VGPKFSIPPQLRFREALCIKDGKILRSSLCSASHELGLLRKFRGYLG
jgi:hypothetical protein